MKKLIFGILLCTLSALIFFGCSCINVQEQKYTELINNTDETVVVKINAYSVLSKPYYIELLPSEQKEIESTTDLISVVSPVKYFDFGYVYTSVIENTSIEINPDGLFVERF